MSRWRALAQRARYQGVVVVGTRRRGSDEQHQLGAELRLELRHLALNLCLDQVQLRLGDGAIRFRTRTIFSNASPWRRCLGIERRSQSRNRLLSILERRAFSPNVHVELRLHPILDIFEPPSVLCIILLDSPPAHAGLHDADLERRKLRARSADVL